jgi:hypothetical protein
MKNKLIIFFLTIISNVALGQNKNMDYETIDKAGWTMTNFSEPTNLTETDSGEVKYLLTLNKKGIVKNIEVLANTFGKEAETKWRREVKKAIFLRQKTDGQINYKGTLLIERERCNKSEVETPTN